MRKPVSVVLVSYNTRDYIKRSLESLLAQLDFPGDDIHLVDNVSSDGTVEMVRREFPQVVIHVNDRNGGYSYACNRGWRFAKNDNILISNGDVIFPPDAVSQLVAYMEKNPSVGILSPQLMGENGTLIQMTWGWNISFFGEMKQKLFAPYHVIENSLIRTMVARLQRNERDVPIVAGACMLVRRSMLMKIDGFDEGFELYFEDADLCLRCWQAGYRVRFVPWIHVFHGLGQSGKSNPNKISLIYRQSQIDFYRKHHTRLELYFMKTYLWIKFLPQILFSKSKLMRYWLPRVLRETAHIHLTDDLT